MMRLPNTDLMNSLFLPLKLNVKDESTFQAKKGPFPISPRDLLPLPVHLNEDGWVASGSLQLMGVHCNIW